VQVPLPLLAVLADVKTAFFGLCLTAGQQVFQTLMEQDRANTEHRHSGIGLLTAHDVHYGLADQRVAARTGVLAAAYAAHPDRFVAGVPRPPARPTEVWINPPRIAAAATPNPAPAGSEDDTGAFRAPYSHAAAPGRPDLRTENQPLSITRLPAAIANEADEPAMTEAALH